MGRRAGSLSNLHLGARDPAGGFVMLGKTFKGITDEVLRWRTERLQQLATRRKGHVVHVRERVVEIAFDGIQTAGATRRAAWHCLHRPGTVAETVRLDLPTPTYYDDLTTDVNHVRT